MATPTAFWDGIAERYAARPVDDPAAYEATLDRVRSYLAPTDRVLEVGCGTGTTALRLADAVAHYTATDFSPRMIEIAEGKRAAAGVENVDFRVASADDAGAEAEAGTGEERAAKEGTAKEEAGGAPFDAIFASSLLHLLPDAPGTLAALRDRLKPGGLLLSKTICLGDMNPVFRLVIPVMRAFGKAPRVSFLRAGDLDAMIRGAGFEIVETGYYPKKLQARFVVARRP